MQTPRIKIILIVLIVLAHATGFKHRRLRLWISPGDNFNMSLILAYDTGRVHFRLNYIINTIPCATRLVSLLVMNCNDTQPLRRNTWSWRSVEPAAYCNSRKSNTVFIITPSYHFPFICFNIIGAQVPPMVSFYAISHFRACLQHSSVLFVLNALPISTHIIFFLLLNITWLGHNSVSIKTSFTKLTIIFFYLIYYLRYLITKSLPLKHLAVCCLTNSNYFFRLSRLVVFCTLF
jgi:hypothetical protein